MDMARACCKRRVKKHNTQSVSNLKIDLLIEKILGHGLAQLVCDA